MVFKEKNLLRQILYFFLLAVSTLANADICTDDYIISGFRSISLLPDIPFEILESNQRLFVRRGTLILEFAKPENITENGKSVKRYSLIFIGDTYYFDLIRDSDNKEIKWEQYAIDPLKRGFGGACRPD